MDPNTASQFASAGTGLVGGLIGMFGNRKANKDAWAKQKWLLEYNTPLNQRKRLEAAGLNPALMYGGGGGSVASASAATPAVRSETEGMPAILNAFVQLAMMDKKKQLIDSQVAQNAQSVVTQSAYAKLADFRRTDQLPSEIMRNRVQNYSTQRSTERADELFPTQLQAAELHNDKISEEIETIKTSRRGIELENSRREIENSNLDARIKAELKEIQERTLNYAVERKLKGGQITSTAIQNYVDEQFKDMARRGITKNDEWYVKFSSKIGEAVGKAVDYISNKF